MSEPQLERSVLQSKDREELMAIAQALGTEPPSRARKGDLVDRILEATGVDSSPAPVQTRPRKRAVPARSAQTRPAEQPTLTTEDPTGEDHQATPSAGSETAQTAASEQAEAPASAGRNLQRSNPKTASPSIESPDSETSNSGIPGAGNPSSANSETSNSENSSSDDDPSQDQVSSPQTRARTPRTNPRRNTSNGAGQRNIQDGERESSDSSPRAESPRGSAQRNSGGGETPARESGRAESRAEEDRNSQESDEGDRPDDRSSQNRFEVEPANRRSRRRRGRDRTDRPERELAGQSSIDNSFSGETAQVTGYLDVRDEGYGFLRATGHLAGSEDVYVSISQVRRYALRRGDYLLGRSRPAGGNEKYPALVGVETINDISPEEARDRPNFEELDPVYPDQLLKLEPDPSNPVPARLVDFVTPIGRGQRALVVSPPHAGRTTLLRQLAVAVESGNPDAKLIVVLIDERPEEVSEMRNAISSEVVATTFDRPSEEHVQVAELVMERARRMVEGGADVVVILDGLTRLARAYNVASSGGGRVPSGGIDGTALYQPKRMFGSARNIQGGGSLTILATALVDTGSRMDDMIFDEFTETANLELRLDKEHSSGGIFPAVSVEESFTRRSELLVGEKESEARWELRRQLKTEAAERKDTDSTQLLIQRIRSTGSNQELLSPK